MPKSQTVGARRAMRRKPRSAQTTRLLMAALAFALLTASAQAQVGGHGRQAHQQPEKSGPQKPKTDDKAYNAALRNIPDKKYDAWHGVR